MTKKIIAVDLDGTLLNSDSQISDFTKETIKKVAEKGHQIIITTGRPYRLSLIHISEPTRLQLISYAVFCLKKKW